MTSCRPGVLVAVLSLLLSGTSAIGKEKEKDEGKPLRRATEPSLCRAYESGSEGYSLRCPKRPDPYRGTNTGLQAAYQIGDAAPKQAEVFQDATSWLVHIPDRVLPGDEVRVELSFRYTPSDAAREALQKELTKFNETVVRDVIQALRTHGADWQAHVGIDPHANPYELLKSARSKDDTPAIPELLEGLGFEQDAASQEWRPTDETLKRLNEAAQKDTEQGLLKETMLKDARKAASICATLLSEPPPDETPEALIGLASRCIGEVDSEVASEAAKATAKAAAASQPTTVDGNACQGLFGPLGALSRFDETTPDDDIVDMRDKLSDAQTNGDKTCPETTLDQLASVTSLLSLSRHVNASRLTGQALRAQLDAVADIIVVNVDLPDARNQLLRADAEYRGYSLSSGAIYLFRLNDLVYPVTVSVCPAGCLRGDEQFWTTENGLGRAISFEVGIAALTADRFDDARRRGGPGFLLGLSVQALAPFKLSGGALVFENQEARRWQADGYLGVTLDAAKAVEMMGLFGVTVPVQLKSTGSDPASKE